MSYKMWFTLATAATMMSATPAFAQRGDGQGREARQRIEAYALNELVTQLALDGDTAQRFREVAVRYQLQIAAVRKDMRQAHQALKQLLDGGGTPDATRLGQLSDQILAGRAKLQALEGQRTVENRKILTPAQFARLLVVWPELSREVRTQVKQNAGGGGQPVAPNF